MHINLPTHAHMRHPLTGEPLRAIGFTKSGKTIWPVMGGSQPTGDPAPTPAPPPAPVPAPVPAPPPAPAPAPVPAPPAPTLPPAPAPVPTPPAQPVTGNGEHGFPENTPLAAMNADQQASYWRYHARQWEGRAKAMSDYDQLKAQAAELAKLQEAAMTDQQRAVAEAEKRGREAALTESGGKLVDAFMRAAIGTRLTEEQIKALMAPLDSKQFLTADGLSVDTAKVSQFAGLVAPAAPAAPAVPPVPGTGQPTPTPVPPVTGAPAPRLDMGQGSTTPAKPSGLAAGREIAAQRFGTNKSTQ